MLSGSAAEESVSHECYGDRSGCCGGECYQLRPGCSPGFPSVRHAATELLVRGPEDHGIPIDHRFVYLHPQAWAVNYLGRSDAKLIAEGVDP